MVLPLPQSGREGTEELKNTRGSQVTGCHTRRTTWGTQEELTVAPMACSCCLVSQVFPTAECLHGNAGQGNVEVDCLNGSMENDVLNEKTNKQTNKQTVHCSLLCRRATTWASSQFQRTQFFQKFKTSKITCRSKTNVFHGNSLDTETVWDNYKEKVLQISSCV